MDTSVTASLLILVLNGVEGIVAVWLYAVIRPRYGPGPKTALLAGFTVWLVGWLIPTLSAIPLNLFPLWVLLVVPGAWLNLPWARCWVRGSIKKPTRRSRQTHFP